MKILTTTLTNKISHFLRRASSINVKNIPQFQIADHNLRKKMSNNIVWFDLEMTGLNVEKDQIMEVACLITDLDLNVVAAGPDIIIHQPDDVLSSMPQWCVVHHGNSGLTEECRRSTTSLRQAEDIILKFLQENCPENKCPMAGNSVYMDRLFLLKYMPRVNAYCHYRIIDVSSIKELVKRWFPHDFVNVPKKDFKHRALEDIKESIKELKYYKSSVFKPN